MKYSELVKQGHSKLFKAGINDADLDAWILFEKICGLSKTEYFEKMLNEVPEENISDYFKAIEKRITHYPLQYIIGEWDFMGLTFMVNENVLIPRQDTEVLVEKAIKIVEEEFDIHGNTMPILDMCTGSGCIGITMAKRFTNAEVTCVDISADALDVAKKNAELNEVTNVSFVESDIFSNVTGKYDMIIANPPYISSDEVDKLMPEVREYEPRIALDGDKDGLKFYRMIIERSKEFLNYEGYILFEIGYDQREEVKELLRQKGYVDIEALKDLSGNDRVVIGRRRKKYV